MSSKYDSSSRSTVDALMQQIIAAERDGKDPDLNSIYTNYPELKEEIIQRYLQRCELELTAEALICPYPVDLTEEDKHELWKSVSSSLSKSGFKLNWLPESLAGWVSKGHGYRMAGTVVIAEIVDWVIQRCPYWKGMPSPAGFVGYAAGSKPHSWPDTGLAAGNSYVAGKTSLNQPLPLDLLEMPLVNSQRQLIIRARIPERVQPPIQEDPLRMVLMTSEMPEGEEFVLGYAEREGDDYILTVALGEPDVR